MVRFLRLLLCAFSLAAIPALATPTTPIAFDAFHAPGSGVALEISKASPAVTTISLRSPDITMENHVDSYENYQVFTLQGESYVPMEGYPAVPQVFRFYRIPNTGGADLVINDSDYDIVDNVNALPYQKENGGALTKDQTMYSTDAWFPTNVATITAPMVMRDFRVVGVTLYPVQVNPVTHQARIYRNISVDVVANNQPSDNEILIPHRPSKSWAPIYRSMISNLDDNALDDLTTNPGTYLIITSTDTLIRPWADSLAEWKIRKGYKVVIHEHPNWTAAQWSTDVRSTYQSSLSTDCPLEYVAIMGDPDWVVGTRNIGISADGQTFDHGYASLTTGDEIEDVGAGRLCGNSTSQMATILAKIKGYERDPHMTNTQGAADTMWFHKAFFGASTAYNCASNYTLMQWGASQFRHYTHVDSAHIVEMYGLDQASSQTAFNQGISFYIWRGSMEEGSASMASGCNSGMRLPVTIEITCEAGTYLGGSGMAETLLTEGTPASPKGGVCGIGTSTPGTHHPENVTVCGGFMYNVTDLGVEHLGDAVAGAKAQLWAAFGSWNGEATNFTNWNNLLGDPGLDMWTAVPTVMNVTHPTSLNVGARRVEVVVQRSGDDVPIADATVCLWKRGSDSTWVRGTTDAAGCIVLPVSVNTPGSMYLTVTKHNHKPYLFTIPVSTVDCMPMVSTCTVDDDNSGGTHGNNDRAINAGETIDLPVYIRNFGTVLTANNITTTMTSSDPLVTVVNGSANYANLAPADSALGSQPFRIQIAPAMPNRRIFQLTVTINSSYGQTTGVLQLVCLSGNLDWQRSQFTDGAFGPGTTRSLSVTVKNTGVVPLTGVSGHLQSFSPFVTVNTADATFGDIAVSARDSNLANPFSLSANPLTFNGYIAPMLLVLTGDNGFVDSTQFSITVGTRTATDPTGPDAGGYYAYDNTDVSYDIHPVFHYEDISGTGENLGLVDVGEKDSVTQIWSTYRVLPFHFRFYGVSYDTLTICSNGWCAFGNQAWYDDARNYPIPGMQAPEAMIAPYWDDLKTNATGQGVWVYHNPDSGQYIIQWKATGTATNEPLDFEVILYDSSARPSLDHNNYILVQYNHVTMNLGNNQDNERPGCTIGIQAPRGLVGLQYAYVTDYTPGSATVQDGRAIVYSTDARVLFGQVMGHVLDETTHLPLPGVLVTADRYGFRDTTDAQGYYHLVNVMIGNYHIIAGKYRFNSDTSASIIVTLDDTTTQDFSLHHPEMTLSIPSLSDTTQDQTIQTSFNIINNGNGLLDYSSRVLYAGDSNPAPWDSVGEINVSGLTGDHQVWGCEFYKDQWWMTGAAGMNGNSVLYRFGLEGAYLGSIPQPATTPLGWFDMATDGQYLYGSDSHWIISIDSSGQVHDSIPSPVNPSRAIAYDPQYDHFWVADYSTDIYEIDRQGQVYRRIPNSGTDPLQITGLAWNATDPNGYKLYVFSRNGSNSQIRVTRYQPSSPFAHETAVDLAGHAGDVAAGCTITPSWNSTLVVFGALLRNASAGDRLGIFEMSFNSSWITLSPATGSVQGGTSRQISVTLSPSILRNATYRVNAVLTSTVYDTTMILPITFVVQHILATPKPPIKEVPKDFALQQNYPNPFNPTTSLSFALPKAEHVQLRVYNSLGQLVTTLVDETRTAGNYTVTWDAHNVSTGLYLYQIRAGNFVETRKMLLMK